MKIAELFVGLLDREGAVSRRVLQNVVEGRQDWKPHEKSMPFGYLANLVATMPDWIAMMVALDEFDLNPPGSGRQPRPLPGTASELMKVLDGAVTKARAVLLGTTDEHLMTPWRLLVGGQVVAEAPRHVMIADTFTHQAHHRGQLTVYLRLNGARVPSLYGPSADEATFG